jgi:hypothetical protein
MLLENRKFLEKKERKVLPTFNFFARNLNFGGYWVFIKCTKMFLEEKIMADTKISSVCISHR